MSRTEIMLRKALKKINELEKRIEKLEPKNQNQNFQSMMVMVYHLLII